ncbi:hypothetical protein LXD69_16950 [Flavobacterium sediminilitoris]|uniref:Restriction endonuclease n=1 Tax=Flavobacterium sediminilitoris TaxID=2024526 RepID=A0ABY4HPJ0_9FLAO|nr:MULTISPECIES: hypothetical protein [Flavobacterium]UOX33709.1 hypothetical protein LXD69_16950 [Flavobacterium sediminilitoris]
MAKLDFEYYVAPDGTNHKDLFEKQIRDKCPEYSDNLQDIIKNGVEVTAEEFFTYGLFEDYNPNNPSFSSLIGFREIAKSRKLEFDSIFSINGTIAFNHSGNTTQQICYAGCGGTLMTANKIFGLNNSEYIRIPEKKGRPKKGTLPGANKTLDFEYLYSNGERFFRVECKGMEGLDGDYSKKANDIIAKKKAQPAGAGDINFGIITQIPLANDTRNAKCILVDPEVPDLEFNPKDYQFYTKLRFYANRLSCLGNPNWLQKIKKYIIQEDVKENQIIENYPYFTIKNNIPLKIMFSSFFEIDKDFLLPHIFRGTILQLEDKIVFIKVIQIKPNNYFAYGFTERLFEIMSNGTIEDFINFKEKPNTIFWKGDIGLRKHRNENDFLVGNISILSTGEVIGILNKEF